MQRLNLSKPLALLACLLMAGLWQNAFAEDGKIYPGSECVRWAGSTALTYNFSAIGNASTSSTLYVDCPVVHDSINSSIHDGLVKAIDLHYSQAVTCQLVSVYRGSGAFYGWFSPTRTTGGTSSAAQTMSFASQGSNSLAHDYYSCHIPPRYNGNTSYIVSYRVDENS